MHAISILAGVTAMTGVVLASNDIKPHRDCTVCPNGDTSNCFKVKPCNNITLPPPLNGDLTAIDTKTEKITGVQARSIVRRKDCVWCDCDPLAGCYNCVDMPDAKCPHLDKRDALNGDLTAVDNKTEKIAGVQARSPQDGLGCFVCLDMSCITVPCDPTARSTGIEARSPQGETINMCLYCDELGCITVPCEAAGIEARDTSDAPMGTVTVTATVTDVKTEHVTECSSTPVYPVKSTPASYVVPTTSRSKAVDQVTAPTKSAPASYVVSSSHSSKAHAVYPTGHYSAPTTASYSSVKMAHTPSYSKPASNTTASKSYAVPTPSETIISLGGAAAGYSVGAGAVVLAIAALL